MAPDPRSLDVDEVRIIHVDDADVADVNDALAQGWASLERDGPHPLLVELYEGLLRAVRGSTEFLGPEDLFELEHGTAVADLGEGPPQEVLVPARIGYQGGLRAPVLTYGLIAANIVVLLLTNKINASGGLGFGGTLNSLGNHLVLYGPAVKNGQDYRLLTAALKMVVDLERVGDHTTNVAETLYFLVHGTPLAQVRPKGDRSSLAVIPGPAPTRSSTGVCASWRHH